jgi:hypothetical protein
MPVSAGIEKAKWFLAEPMNDKENVMKWGNDFPLRASREPDVVWFSSATVIVAY